MTPHALLFLVLLLPLPQESTEPSPKARRDEWQYLTKHFTLDGFDTKKPPQNGGYTGRGNSFLEGHLPAGERIDVNSARFGKVQFVRPPLEGTKPNMMLCQGQEIRINTKRIFNVLFTLCSGHHGPKFGWVEFRFEDGTTARGPLGVSDWWREPTCGDEIAFTLPRLGSEGSGRGNLFLQHTAIPAGKRLVSIKLPDVPQAKVLGLTLGWREGIRPLRTPSVAKPEPGLVAIFSEPGFPHYRVRADLTPARIQSTLAEAGIPAALLSLQHLKDPEVFHPEAYPAFVNPYGSTYPTEAEDNIRAYRKAGGVLLCFGVPFSHPVDHFPYGNWIDRGQSSACLTHDGERAMGTVTSANVSDGELVAAPQLAAWGLEGVAWGEFLPRGTEAMPYGANRRVIRSTDYAETDEITPLLHVKSNEQQPLAAIVRHKSCPFDGCIDIRLGQMCVGQEPLEAPVELGLELVLRSIGSVLHEKGLIGKDLWGKITRPIAEPLRTRDSLEPVFPDPAWGWRLPSGPGPGEELHWVDVTSLHDTERVLFASAQGLINRSGKGISAYLVESGTSRFSLEWYQAEGLVKKVVPTDPRRLLEQVGHRRAIVVDRGVRGSLNLAVMVAAAEGLLVAHPELLEKYDLEIAADLRGLFRTQAECYRWALQNVWPSLDHRCLAMVKSMPSLYHTVDYLIARKIFTFWVSRGTEAFAPGASRADEHAFACELLAKAPVATAVLTIPSSAGGTYTKNLLDRFGKYRVRLSNSTGTSLANLSFTAGLMPPPGTAEGEPASPSIGSPPKLELDKVYVSCVRSPFLNLWSLDRAVTTSNVVSESTPRGHALPTAAFDLFPVQAARLAARLEGRQCLGTSGLGIANSAVFGAAFEDKAQEVESLFWKLRARSLDECRLEFLALTALRGTQSGKAPAWVRSIPTTTALLLGQPASPSTEPGDYACLLEGKPAIRQISPSLLLRRAKPDDALTVFNGQRPAFVWTSAHASFEQALSHAPDAVLVSPSELAALCKDYLENYAPETIPLIAEGSTWSYNDSGKALAGDWSSIEHDDSSWSSGPAVLGFGEAGSASPEKTVVSFGPDQQHKHPTTYFRHSFELEDPGRFTTLSLQVLRDDGCVVYVNGREVGRSNLPEGEISFTTLALKTVGSSDERAWHRIPVKPRHFRKGKNVIAVEVHQTNATSSDLSFDCQLTAFRSRDAAGEDGKEEKNADAPRDEPPAVEKEL